MPTPPMSDDVAREAFEVWQRHRRSRASAAEELGIARTTLDHRLAVAKERQLDLDPAIRDSMAAVGTSLTPALAWAKTKSEDGTSYSVLLKPDPLPDEALDRIRAAFEGMKPAKPVTPPPQVMADLCTVYPLFDAHFGMLAWGRETGSQDYDIGLAAGDMRHAFAKINALTPASDTAVLLIGGDFFHADDNRAETPASKHKLDVDGRHFKVLREGITIIAEVIETLLAKHHNLRVRVLRGNHDEHAHMVLTFALSERYREEARIEVDVDPRDLFMMQWGKALIAAHHGDKAKPQQLTLYLSDVCPFWSETRHRHMFVGHVHHDAAKDIGPLRWESLRAFTPPDSYAAGMGYGGRRAQQAITFHKEDGLVLRALDPIERIS